jgi:hypothetical protein
VEAPFIFESFSTTLSILCVGQYKMAFKKVVRRSTRDALQQVLERTRKGTKRAAKEEPRASGKR